MEGGEGEVGEGEGVDLLSLVLGGEGVHHHGEEEVVALPVEGGGDLAGGGHGCGAPARSRSGEKSP